MSEKKTVKLQQEIVRWEGKTAELGGQREQAVIRAADLEYQRGRHVLAALAEDDLGAKKELEKLTLELEGAVRHSADLALACQQAGERVDLLRWELSGAERADNEEQLLRLLKRREGIGHEMARLLDEHVLPLLSEASGISDEMDKWATRLGLLYSVRPPAFTDLLAYPAWAVLKTFPVKLSTIHMEPLEARDFRPPDLSLDPVPALAAHDEQFRRRLLKEIGQKRQAASGTKIGG